MIVLPPYSCSIKCEQAVFHIWALVYSHYVYSTNSGLLAAALSVSCNKQFSHPVFSRLFFLNLAAATVGYSGKETWREHLQPRVTENEQVKMPTRGHQSPVWRDIIPLKKSDGSCTIQDSWKRKKRKLRKTKREIKRNPQSGIWGIRTFKHCAS